MQKRTHIAVGVFFALMILVFITPKQRTYEQIIFIACAIVASLIADIDTAKSYVGRKVKIIGWMFKHRGFFHSLLFGTILTIVTIKLIPEYAWACIVGYASHILLDAYTYQGEQFFWPSNLKWQGFMKTGSLTELIIFVIFVILDAYLILLL